MEIWNLLVSYIGSVNWQELVEIVWIFVFWLCLLAPLFIIPQILDDLQKKQAKKQEELAAKVAPNININISPELARMRQIVALQQQMAQTLRTITNDEPDETPNKLEKRPNYGEQYDKTIPIVLDTLPPLPHDIHGIIAQRHWSYNYKSGYLDSVGMDYTWKSSIETSASIHGNMYGGIHAYKINSLQTKRMVSLTSTYIGGLVELRGKVVEHSDSVLRAEWARILFLICPDALCIHLSKLYGVPVIKGNGIFLDQEWVNKINEGYKWVQTQI